MYIGRNTKAAVKLLEAAGGDYALLTKGLSVAARDPRTGEIRFADALAAIRALRGETSDREAGEAALRHAS